MNSTNKKPKHVDADLPPLENLPMLDEECGWGSSQRGLHRCRATQERVQQTGLDRHQPGKTSETSEDQERPAEISPVETSKDHGRPDQSIRN